MEWWRIALVILVFAVLGVLVFTGKLKPMGGHSKTETAHKEREGKSVKKRGTVETAYLIAADSHKRVLFEVHYSTGQVTEEPVDVFSPRYEELKEKEPRRVRLSYGKGTNIIIEYADGRTVDCPCKWLNLEASQLRADLLKQDAPEK